MSGKSDQSALDAAKRRIDPAKLLIALVGIPSPSGREAAISEAVCEWAAAFSLPAERIGRNVVIRIGKGQGKRLLFNSHLDTVLPVSSWRTDPFSPVVLKNRVIGLGANDAKGCVAAMLCAVARAAGRSIPGEVVLALSVDEESDTARGGLVSLIDSIGKLDAAVIGEPTNLAICRAQKGRMLLEAETSGIARHSAHAHRIAGGNAVVKAARAICALDAWDPGPAHPLLGRTTCQVTVISGGERSNVIPDRCVFRLDLRTVEMAPPDKLIRQMGKITGAKVRLVGDNLMPFETDENAEIVNAARTARPAARLVASSTMSDAVWTRHLPTIKIGPGKTERSHTAGEYITLKELRDGALFYEKLLYAYFA